MSFRNARIYRKRHSTERPRSFSSPLVIRSGLIPKTASPQNVSMSTMGILRQRTLLPGADDVMTILRKLLFKTEVHLHRDLGRYRNAILRCRLKPPCLDRIDRLLIQSLSKRPYYLDVAWIAVGTNNQGKYAGALKLGFARLF